MLFRRLTTILLLLMLPVAAFTLGFEALTLGFSQAWTGNGYVPTPDEPGGPYDFDVTGSEPTPIDPFVSFGARFVLIERFLGPSALSSSPAIQIGWRYYVLFDSGRVAPAQIETATGAEGTTLGLGSSRVLTVRIPVPIAYEVRFAGGSAAYMSISPTATFRLPAGDVVTRDEDTNLAGMYGFFYSRMRFLMPEFSLGYRFAMSESLEATIHATYGVSVLDVIDETLPWYDQTRLAVGIDLGLRPPVSGLGRRRERVLPAGIDPFPEDE